MRSQMAAGLVVFMYSTLGYNDLQPATFRALEVEEGPAERRSVSTEIYKS